MTGPAHRTIQLPRMLMAVILYSVLTGLLPVGSARAREGEAVSRGARIRVFSSMLAPRPVVGSLVNLVGDTLVMAAESDTHAVALALASVRTLEISRGRETHRGSYAGIGFLIGAGIGALIGAATYSPSQGDFSLDFGKGFAVGGGALVGGLFGAGLGVAVGSVGSERWVPVDPAAVRITWQPAGRGGTVSALIHF